MKQVRLLCKKPIPTGQEFLVTTGQATIGKDTSNTISLPYKAISRRHATIIYDESESCYFLEDLKSHNGTLLDGERVRRKERLDSIHVITISNKFDIFFQILDEQNESEPALSETEEMKEDEKVTIVKEARQKAKSLKKGGLIDLSLDSSRLPAGPGRSEKKSQEKRVVRESTRFDDVIAYPAEPTVTIEKTRLNIPASFGSEFVFEIEGTSLRYSLNAGENIVGRSRECSVTLADKTVSNRHACMVVDNNEIRLRDLESKNHTYVGDSLVKCWTRVKPDAKIRFGKVVGILKVQTNAAFASGN